MRSPKSNHLFSAVPSVEMPRSAFRRDRTYKTTFDAGFLVPIYLDEVLPGDTFNLNLTAFARLATPIVPFMDNLYMDFQFFFVPNRLVWKNWEKFCGAQDNPGDSIDYLIPQFSSNVPTGSLGDYFGLPVGSSMSVSALPFRAYNLIWNECYRDENLQDSLPVYTDDGPDPVTYTTPSGVANQAVYQLRKRGKRKDYFTACLPWPQKGPGVEVPLGGYAPVVNTFDSSTSTVPSSSLVDPALFNSVTGAKISDVRSLYVSGGSLVAKADSLSGGTVKAGLALSADLSAASLVTINTLRQAFQVQRFLEREARSGSSRYFEILVSHFGVRSPDSRLQRPEYLGGGTVPVSVRSIAQTSATDESSATPQGNLAAVGVAGSPSAVSFSKSFVEHGYIIGLVSVRADLTYQQGIDRMWSRRTRYDFYWPVLAHLGEQAVLNKEIFYSANPTVDNKVFGYQERYAEYRYGVSKITGKLRSTASGSLDCWHLSQYFQNCPQLNSEFIEENPPLSRVVAVIDEPQFIYDSLVSVNCVRPMPVYSVPGLIDHF